MWGTSHANCNCDSYRIGALVVAVKAQNKTAEVETYTGKRVTLLARSWARTPPGLYVMRAYDSSLLMSYDYGYLTVA